MARGRKTGATVALPVDSPSESQWLAIVGARHNNLRNITVEVPLARFVCVTGVSGSGKSSLVNDILFEALRRDLNGAEGVTPGDFDRIDGLEHLDKVIDIDQSPIGRTPRSNPATYIKLFDEIRSLFSRLPDSRARGYKPGRFSFNVATGSAGGGRCEICEGYGANRLEMDFLADIWVTCPVCSGRRFSRETLEVLYKGRSIADVLDMDVQQALEHFANVPAIAHMLQTLHDVGLDYLKLGQSSATLSGGEAQRIKLARELVRRSTGRTLYLLDEPTTGLHFADIKRLLDVLHGFVDAGNTVVVIEHNLDVIKTADWVIDLGPEGGAGGGLVVAAGTPEQVAGIDASHTGRALQEVFEKKVSTTGGAKRSGRAKSKRTAARAGTLASADRFEEVSVFGARQNNLKGIDVAFPRSKMTVCCGPSGSGKSSFAVDTIYGEGQRRYVESLSAYARQFLGRVQPARVERIDGLSPAICIEQRATSRSPRSTVGTVTEIYDYMRVLWARVGMPHCPKCDTPIGAQEADMIVDRLLSLPVGSQTLILAPVQPAGQESIEQLLQRERANGYARARIDGVVHALDDKLPLSSRRRHKVELVIDRVEIHPRKRSRLADSVELALVVGQGVMLAAVAPPDGTRGDADADPTQSKPKTRTSAEELFFSKHRACATCGVGYEELSPNHFSFNSRLGWCPQCEGIGSQAGTTAMAIATQPGRSIVDGAIGPWGVVPESSPLHLVARALADHLGFDLHRPWSRLTDAQRMALQHGCGDEWLSIPRDARDEWQGVRIRWRGFVEGLRLSARTARGGASAPVLVDVPCGACHGSRLRPDAAAVRLSGQTIHAVCGWPLSRSLDWFGSLKLDARERRIAGELLHEVTSRLRFLVDVGLDYVSLDRTASTLSGGEAQRIQLAAQIGTGLTGVLYVLDEPTIGLHPRDNHRLIAALQRLRDLGNTLLLVEHDREVIGAADHVLDFGPGAGADGGEVTASGTPRAIRSARRSLTGRYLSERENITVPSNRREVRRLLPAGVNHFRAAIDEPLPPRSGLTPESWLVVHEAIENNLKRIDVGFPLGRFTCVTGVSGSGKSTLVNDVLCRGLQVRIHRASVVPGAHAGISGVEHVDKLINVDQSPIGITPTSNPATYTGVFDVMRELYARLPVSRMRGYTANRFSFNRAGGRCEACEGMGARCIEMHFLPDVWVPCESCGGRRYTRETLEVQYKGVSIADALAMRVSEAVRHFANMPKLVRLLQTLDDVGLGYVQLGQSATTLSGGEAQRVKLAAELGRPSTGRTLYVLDEPTTGLHFDDLKKLLAVLHRLVDLGNTVICIEHNLDVIKTADWLIDLGPEGGAAGGEIVIEGTPEQVAQCARSYSGAALAPVLARGPVEARASHAAQSDETAERPRGRARDWKGGVEPAAEPLAPSIDVDAAEMPWDRDGKTWHTQNPVDGSGRPVKWDVDVLTWLVESIEQVDGFAATDWGHRTKVEITAPSAPMWFCHVLTGGSDLLDVSFRVARGAFVEKTLVGRLGIKSLDERTDLPIYGRASRVRVCTGSQVWQNVRLALRDFKDVNKPAFVSFIKEAAASYFQTITRVVNDERAGRPWEVDGQAWHLSQQSIRKRASVRWQPTALVALVGRFKTIAPQLEVDWKAKVMIRLCLPGESSAAGRIITNRPDGLRIELRAPRGAVTPAMIDRMGRNPSMRPAGGGADWVVFWARTPDDIDVRQLRDVWVRCRGANKPDQVRSA